MDAIERDELLKALKRSIEMKYNGTASEIATRFNISRRTLFRLLNHLSIREGKEIKYSKRERCFEFCEGE